MIIKKNFIISCLFIFLSYFQCNAQENILFSLDTELGQIKKEDIFSAWNPAGKKTRTPGIKVYFFGKGEGCLSTTVNGPVVEVGEDINPAGLTGLPFNKNLSFTPSGNTESCSIEVRDKKGDSFVYINNIPGEKGIALFSSSGINKNRKRFFQTRGAEGVKGVNFFMQSNALTFKFKKEEIFPFKDKKGIKIITKATVKAIPLNLKTDRKPIQVRHQFEIGFANRACLNEKTEKTSCLVKYVFDVFVKRWGGSPLKIQRGAKVFIDKAQGNLAHISSFIESDGEKIFEEKTQLPVAISCGEGIKKDIPFTDKNFCIYISWNNFQNSLKAIVLNKLKQTSFSITENEIINLFGKDYNNPEEWYLTVISFQQELHDPYEEQDVFIGGNFKSFRLIQQ